MLLRVFPETYTLDAKILWWLLLAGWTAALAFLFTCLPGDYPSFLDCWFLTALGGVPSSLVVQILKTRFTERKAKS